MTRASRALVRPQRDQHVELTKRPIKFGAESLVFLLHRLQRHMMTARALDVVRKQRDRRVELTKRPRKFGAESLVCLLQLGEQLVLWLAPETPGRLVTFSLGIRNLPGICFLS